MTRVAIEFLLTGSCGRSRLHGVFEFLRGRRAWDIRLPQTEEDLLHELDAQPDGVIVSHAFSPATLRRLERLDVPVIFVDIPKDERKVFRPNDVTIRNDDGGIGLMAARYLSSLGSFNTYGFVPFRDPSRYFSRRRAEAFSQFLVAHGKTVAVFPGGDAAELEAWLKSLDKPAAVFAAMDEAARDVVNACQRLRIRIPEQLVLLGTDDDELICALSKPEISSIHPDTEAEGYRAAEELDKLMRHPSTFPPKSVLVKPVRITERASTKPPPPALHLVRRALAYIAANATKGITPDDVARHLGCSRRLLDLRFKALHTATVQEELTAARLAAVRAALLKTNKSMAQIAADCGFRSPAVLKNLFKRTYGQSMRAFKARSQG